MGWFDNIQKRLKPVGKGKDIAPITQPRKEDAKNISRFIAPNAFNRIKQDAKSWKEALTEAEYPFYPHRVKMQQLYLDTIINPHVDACLKRRFNLVLLKQFGLYQGNSEVADDNLYKLFNRKWFFDFMQYALEAKAFGYSLIELGDLEQNNFPKISIVKRQNVSPDRLNVTAFTYGISGVNFMDNEAKDDSGESYADWTVYVPTPSEIGASKCGYGYLYKIASLEILLRNLLGFNANFVELYGQPIRHAKTSKLEGPEYDTLATAMDEMGHNNWLITDIGDELNLLDGGSSGTGYKSYDNFEERLEKKISKVILGHADALDSVPGKLGAGQDGKASATDKALEDIETIDSRFVEYVINDILIPKLINIGFPIAPGVVFKFKNDKEKQEIRANKDNSNTITATYVKSLSDAGVEVDADWLAKHMDIPLTKKEVILSPTPFTKEIQNKLNKTYDNL